MKLNKEDLVKIIHNVFSCEFDDDGAVHFRRFSPSQLNAYEAESKHWTVRANASASVTLDFVSDTEYIALKFDLYPGSSHEWAGFDLYVDGIFHEHKRFDKMSATLVSFSLPEGEHRITLYFPWSVETVVKEVHLSDGATVTHVTKKGKAVFLGDSITQGYITPFPSLSYVNQVARELDIEVVNQGIGGYYFGKNTIDETLSEANFDFLVVAYGTNDYSRNDAKEEFETAAKGYIEKLTSLFGGTKILAILPVYRNDEGVKAREKYRSYSLDDARAILSALYKKHKNVHVLEETKIPRIPTAFASDYLHPNELGFTFMAKAIEKEISKWL